MATNKKPVMVYLPEWVEVFVSDYCLSNDITIEKDGITNPRMGTGIVRLLESLIESDGTVKGKSLSPNIGVSETKVKALEKSIEVLRGDYETAIAQLRGELAAMSKPEPIEERIQSEPAEGKQAKKP